ncbi:hypothetical protein [Planktotalea arctica]|uniref:hypothetical protein n=1 Tax=Planktotalea arctica TaxID=1481893 RepID=UPI00111C5C53|nr:hypothetical protein [Planktotalea arctica]
MPYCAALSSVLIAPRAISLSWASIFAIGQSDYAVALEPRDISTRQALAQYLAAKDAKPRGAADYMSSAVPPR